ncbi:MAG TPA: hypothetical protein VHU14_07745 [Solirubrobacterales bacterium]|jgi:hypothetical protein|nr:hypothetical protein [Solirubrobacterales bacterium]
MRIPTTTRALVISLLSLAVLAAAGTAIAKHGSDRVELRAGNLIIIGHGGFKPETLPRTHDAPITIYGGGKLSTVSGEVPPILEKLTFEFDKHGHVDTTGLEVCTAGKLQATDVPAARRACPNAIVGEGFGSGVVTFPEQKPIPVSSPLTIFNGPKVHGDDTVLGHFYTTVPVATTFIVPVVIEKIHKGVYGYRVEAKIPKIAGGYGHPLAGHLTINRKWTYRGKKHSYVNARCETGHLLARGEFTFNDGTLLKGTFFRPCKVAK